MEREHVTLADDPAGIHTAIEIEAARITALVEGYAIEAATTVASWMSGEEAIA